MHPQEYEGALRSTEFIDWETPSVRAYARKLVGAVRSPRERAIRIFYGVRDEILYDVDSAPLSRPAMRASAIIESRIGFCIHKCITFVALARSVGIPSRLAFSDVKNHLSTPRMRALVGGDVFRYHAHAEIHLAARWTKVTPVFNRNLCRLFSVPPLEFDGIHDATMQSFRPSGDSYLETLHDHGVFDEFPYEQCLAALSAAHPLLVQRSRTREASGRRVS